MHRRRSPVVIGIGELLWDMLPGGKQLGGAPANFAFHAAQLGARSRIVSSVGNDALGIDALGRLNSLRLDTSLVAIHPTWPTGTVAVTLDAAGVPSYIIRENVAWDEIHPSHALDELAPDVDVLCFGTLALRSPTTRGTVERLAQRIRRDALRVWDVNLRQHYYDAQTIASLVNVTDVLKLNDLELPVVAGLLGLPTDVERASTEMVNRFGLKALALTRGDKGSRIYLRDGRISDHPGIPATIADTVGAGDAFTAVLSMGLYHNVDIDHITTVANAVAAYVCSQPGATPTMSPHVLELWSRTLAGA